MLYPILVASFLLGSCLTVGCRLSEAEKTLRVIRERPDWLDEVTNSSTILSDCNYDRVDLKRIIASAIKVLDFFEMYLEDLVIDAAIGTRIMECK